MGATTPGSGADLGECIDDTDGGALDDERDTGIAKSRAGIGADGNAPSASSIATDSAAAAVAEVGGAA